MPTSDRLTAGAGAAMIVLTASGVFRDGRSVAAHHDFNDAILSEVAHRPWPRRDAPWVMTQTWNDLLFAHWPIEPSRLARTLPPGLPLDTFDGQAWLGIVPFWMSNVSARTIPALPWISEFPELNVRTYVRVGDKPGVFFFSLDAARSLAVRVARLTLNLPYFTADMHVDRDGSRITYASRRLADPAMRLEATYWPIGAAARPQPGTLEYFLTERYCLYGVRRDGTRYRLEIHHPPWPLQSAEAHFTVNTMAAAAGLALPGATPLLHFAKRQDMVAWLPQALTPA